ncbi:hypothetical protein M758_7G187600 [Ceratodon purpureus]|uniref:Uncharacterized protein n=1 Tax=Ceratodon purpureus TaxID=3225 RepID=A0A8T0H892_CERPU|nr:hypothetical protein KC19_7G190900 [Ceratodon purpureus]KAG0612063.1 hypothetical protein M758_7G187600 [Ceratodon purpureus]
MDDRVPASADPPPDHSSLIASKLLQGWTLLADSCPVCLTPLVRNRQKQLFCVSCSQWLLTEDQLALKLQAQHVHDSSPPPSHLPKPPAPPPSHMRVASLRDDGPSSDERSPKRQASTELLSGTSFNILEDTNMTASPPGSSDQYISTLPKVLSNVNPPVVLSNLVSTLYQKVEEIRQSIAACQEIRDLTQLLSALGECMQAIQRAENLLQPGHPGKL